MSITTIRLSDERRARIETVAVARDASMHAFMLAANVEVIERVERRQDFEAEAQRRWKKLLRTGEYLTLEDVRSYAMALARGEQPAEPPLRKMTPDALARWQASARRMGDG